MDNSKNPKNWLITQKIALENGIIILKFGLKC